MTLATVRLATLEREISLRLRGICPQMAPECFDAMVEEMAAIQYKFEKCEGVSYANLLNTPRLLDTPRRQ